MTDPEITKSIANQQGVGGGLFTPDQSFINLTKKGLLTFYPYWCVVEPSLDVARSAWSWCRRSFSARCSAWNCRYLRPVLFLRSDCWRRFSR